MHHCLGCVKMRLVMPLRKWNVAHCRQGLGVALTGLTLGSNRGIADAVKQPKVLKVQGLGFSGHFPGDFLKSPGQIIGYFDAHFSLVNHLACYHPT